jgi:Protein of unknown function (DUF2844)
MKPLIAGIMLLVIFVPLQVKAALGGDVTSIEADRAQMNGKLQVRPANAYTVHEITGANHTMVREYISPAGVVFGVGWEGQFMPDMQQLLGAYFDQYTQAVKQQKASYVGRRPLDIQLPGLVVQRSGHMRAFAGHAYIPEQVPQGVRVEDLW